MLRRWLNVSKAFQKNSLVLETLQPTAEKIEQWYWMGIDDDITQGFVYGHPRMLIHLLIRKLVNVNADILQKVVADDVADDVADTFVKAKVVKVADVAAKIVHTPAVADLEVLVDKIVMDVAGMDVPKQDDVVLNELHTPDRCQIPNATDLGSVRSVRVVGEGRTDFNARSPSDKRHIDAYLIYLAKRMMHRGGSEYAITDSYFFNWHWDFHEISQHVVAYVSEIRPDWGSE
ncbi:hypothetical protein Dimus_006147 [Dionaea muscipula]